MPDFSQILGFPPDGFRSLEDDLDVTAPQVVNNIETLVQFDPDIIIVSALRKDNYDNSVAVAQQKWEDNPLLQKMRAVQAGRIRFVNDKLFGRTREGVIASKLVLDLLPEMLLPFVEEE